MPHRTEVTIEAEELVSRQRLPEVAFYYPNRYLLDVDRAKNLILFVDGIALLIPEYIRPGLDTSES